LERKLVEKVWGGRNLAEFGIELPKGVDIGETWELYDREDGSSRLRNSEWTVHDLLERDAEAWLGADISPTPQGRFPLLLKYIDAASPLSVQVHPDDLGALRDADLGKHEAWVVLSTRPEAWVIRGFRDGVSREQVLQNLNTPQLEELLFKFTPQPGDAIRIPPGMPHALGPGVTLFEVQQNSDLTYRLYDWGRPRKLHLQRGMDVMRFDQQSQPVLTPTPSDDGTTWLIRDSHFRVRRVTIDLPKTLSTADNFKVLNVINGRARLSWPDGDFRVDAGDTVLVPGATPHISMAPQDRCTFLWTSPGRVLRDRNAPTPHCAPPPAAESGWANPTAGLVVDDVDFLFGEAK
jgi:mannose-6-phosphate isomerase